MFENLYSVFNIKISSKQNNFTLHQFRSRYTHEAAVLRLKRQRSDTDSCSNQPREFLASHCGYKFGKTFARPPDASRLYPFVIRTRTAQNALSPHLRGHLLEKCSDQVRFFSVLRGPFRTAPVSPCINFLFIKDTTVRNDLRQFPVRARNLSQLLPEWTRTHIREPFMGVKVVDHTKNRDIVYRLFRISFSTSRHRFRWHKIILA